MTGTDPDTGLFPPARGWHEDFDFQCCLVERFYHIDHSSMTWNQLMDRIGQVRRTQCFERGEQHKPAAQSEIERLHEQLSAGELSYDEFERQSKELRRQAAASMGHQQRTAFVAGIKKLISGGGS